MCETFNVKLETLIGCMEINGCSNGLHHIVRPTSSSALSSPNISDKTNKKKNQKCFSVIQMDSGKVPKPVRQTIEWFEKYFNSNKSSSDLDNLKEFGSKLPLCSKIQIKYSSLALKVYEHLWLNIKLGQYCSYSDVANKIGHPKAQRPIGNHLKKNPLWIMIPCHRIIKKNGNLGKYGGKEDATKQWLLDHEKTLSKNQN